MLLSFVKKTNKNVPKMLLNVSRFGIPACPDVDVGNAPVEFDNNIINLLPQTRSFAMCEDIGIHLLSR